MPEGQEITVLCAHLHRSGTLTWVQEQFLSTQASPWPTLILAGPGGQVRWLTLIRLWGSGPLAHSHPTQGPGDGPRSGGQSGAGPLSQAGVATESTAMTTEPTAEVER